VVKVVGVILLQVVLVVPLLRPVVTAGYLPSELVVVEVLKLMVVMVSMVLL
jgi:hypothetical protein